MQYLRPRRHIAGTSPGNRAPTTRIEIGRAGRGARRHTVFRPVIGEEEIAAVKTVLRSGWLTTGSQGPGIRGEVRRLHGGETSRQSP